MHPAHHQIQDCVQQCEQAAQRLRTISGQEQHQTAKRLLTEAAHHLDLCITECRFSMTQLQGTAM